MKILHGVRGKFIKGYKRIRTPILSLGPKLKHEVIKNLLTDTLLENSKDSVLKRYFLIILTDIE